MTATDTIFALSSGAGRAGIAVIRVSGSRAGPAILSFTETLPSRRQASLRRLRAPSNGELIDQAMMLWMPAPESATGEDMAEFHVHGSAAVIDTILAELSALPGLRVAEAGEFTRRAFVNGKMDLVEVEGLADLLDARTAAQRQLAVRHMLGDASSVYEHWRESMQAILAWLEAAIDFADEDGVVADALARVRPQTLALINELSDAAGAAGRAGRVRDGVRVVFMGAPNVGKSSLLNAIAKREAAIVSAMPGTTRDVIEAPVVLAGIPVILTDTAGLRGSTDDDIERIGIERARAAGERADIKVWLSAPGVTDDLAPPEGMVIPVVNKKDLIDADSIHYRNDYRLFVSARTGEGVTELVNVLERKVLELTALAPDFAVVRQRHLEAVRESIRMLNESLQFDSRQIEFAAECVRNAATEMARVTGRIGVEDVLGKIFSSFCIGK